GNYVNWFNDSQVCAYNAHHFLPYTREKGENYIKKINNSSTDLCLAIILKENNLHIGNIALQNINFIHRNAEFAIVLGEKDYWGKGYSKEASVLIVKHGFIELNLHRIYCGTSSENIAMQKLAMFLCLQEEGRRIDAIYKSGEYVDIFEYGVIRDSFLSQLKGGKYE
ncbi:MAG: GNAT family N-acetyltransferase, partial [Candidatus Gastranaerophilaceae bacterium]